MALSYKEQLQHPLWQRKRLAIFERDNFTCLICGETDNFIFILFSTKLVIDLMKLTKQNFNQLSDIDNTIALMQINKDYEYLEALKIEYLKLIKHS